MKRTVVVGVLVALVVGACASSDSRKPMPPSSTTMLAASTSALSTAPSTSKPTAPSSTAAATTVAGPSQFGRDVALIMGFYDGWSRAVAEGQDAIEAYFATHLYPGLPACAPGEKQFGALSADGTSIGPVDDWSITWGPLSGTIPEGRIYQVRLAEQDSPSHVTILDDLPYVFWNCTGVIPASSGRNVFDLPFGLTCRDLFNAGYNYADVFRYWQIAQQTDDGALWIEGDEVICESVYPAAELETFWEGSLNVGSDASFADSTAGGRYAFVLHVDQDAQTMVADYAEIYSGDAATKACLEDGFATEDCESFQTRLVYVRNNNPRLRTLSIADDVAFVRWTWFGATPTECEIPTPRMLRELGIDWTRSGPSCLHGWGEFAKTWDRIIDGRSEWVDENGWLEDGGYGLFLALTDGEVSAIQEPYSP